MRDSDADNKSVKLDDAEIDKQFTQWDKLAEFVIEKVDEAYKVNPPDGIAGSQVVLAKLMVCALAYICSDAEAGLMKLDAKGAQALYRKEVGDMMNLLIAHLARPENHCSDLQQIKIEAIN